MSSDVTLWAGDRDFLNWPRAQCGAFSEFRIKVLADISKRLLEGSYSAPLKALGFWLREAQLRQWQQDYTQDDKTLLAPIGRVFIVSPSNVEGLFAYSWALSFLMGNQTVVRVSDKLTDDQKALFELFQSIQAESPVFFHQAFISYDKRSDWTEQLSYWCQLRMLWGSDSSVEDIRRIALPAQVQEWVFPDRYSVSILHIEEADKPKLAKMAEGFARDVSTYQQQACASPKWVFWYQTDEALQKQFWQAVDACLLNTGAFAKNESFVASQYLCALGGLEVYNRHLHVVEAQSVLGSEQSLIGIVGQTSIEMIERCASLLPSNLQSVASYGLSHLDKEQLAIRSNVRQFAPLGQALSFDLVWDGVDLVGLLSRLVRF